MSVVTIRRTFLWLSIWALDSTVYPLPLLLYLGCYVSTSTQSDDWSTPLFNPMSIAPIVIGNDWLLIILVSCLIIITINRANNTLVKYRDHLNGTDPWLNRSPISRCSTWISDRWLTNHTMLNSHRLDHPTEAFAYNCFIRTSHFYQGKTVLY